MPKINKRPSVIEIKIKNKISTLKTTETMEFKLKNRHNRFPQLELKRACASLLVCSSKTRKSLSKDMNMG